MSKNHKEWNARFLKYMELICNHPNYTGLPIERKTDGSLRWIAPAKSEIGQGRIEWANKKAIELGLQIRAGVYADVMLEIHPNKWKVCQTCGKLMSLYYHYPNHQFLVSLNRTFKCDFNDCDHISDIWDALIERGVRKEDLARFLIDKGNLDLDYRTAAKDKIINELEYACRKGGKKCLGPGAMSNFHDRFDGFHTYNRCCRVTQAMGRSKENMKSYTRDRRAYEYWSDGNIHAANQFMGSSYFDGISADHIGPISLGFVHDPRYLQPMTSSDNSSKRDRLQIEDIENIIETEERTGIYPMSWYSKLIWEFIRDNYKSYPDMVSTVYRDALKQNMTNYMYILRSILELCPKNGELFLIKTFLEPHYDCFRYSYEFNSRGEIINRIPRHYTARNQNEMDRYVRIAMEAVREYGEKDNRNNKPDFTKAEIDELKNICRNIEYDLNMVSDKQDVIFLVQMIEERIISSM